MLFFFFDLNKYSASDLIDRIKSIKPIKEVIEETGISQPVFSQWKSRNSFPNSYDLYKISCCLNVSMEWLLTGQNEQDKTLPDTEKKLLEHYRSLDPLNKKNIDLMIEAVAGK